MPNLDVEIALTRLRRWLLLERRWTEFPHSTGALAVQALPSRRVQARYFEQNPADLRFRDFDARAKFESENPMLFLRTYDFWCGKPRA